MSKLLQNPYVQSAAAGVVAYYVLSMPQAKQSLSMLFNADGSPKYKNVTPTTLSLAAALVVLYYQSNKAEGYQPMSY